MKGKQNGALDNRLMRQARSCGAQIRSRSWMLYLEIPLVGALSGARRACLLIRSASLNYSIAER